MPSPGTTPGMLASMSARLSWPVGAQRATIWSCCEPVDAAGLAELVADDARRRSRWSPRPGSSGPMIASNTLTTASTRTAMIRRRSGRSSPQEAPERRPEAGPASRSASSSPCAAARSRPGPGADAGTAEPTGRRPAAAGAAARRASGRSCDLLLGDLGQDDLAVRLAGPHQLVVGADARDLARRRGRRSGRRGGSSRRAGRR